MTARHDLEPGDAVTLDYGRRPLRDMLRNYGCVLQAANSPNEVSIHKQLTTATHVRPQVPATCRNMSACKGRPTAISRAFHNL